MAGTRNAGAKYFIPTENEWYKAAYYDPLNGGAGGYWTYPTQEQHRAEQLVGLAPTSNNDANYYNSGYTDPTNYLTPVGTFEHLPALSGRMTWAATSGSGTRRISPVRFGGCVAGRGTTSPTTWPPPPATTRPTNEDTTIGFRVASVPEPGSIALLLACAVAFGIWRWRTSKSTGGV